MSLKAVVAPCFQLAIYIVERVRSAFVIVECMSRDTVDRWLGVHNGLGDGGEGISLFLINLCQHNMSTFSIQKAALEGQLDQIHHLATRGS